METIRKEYFNYEIEDDEKKTMSSTEKEQLKTEILAELNKTSEVLKGEKGDRGYSAYEIWLGQGNKGTEQDFINSLKGEQRGEATATGSDFE